MTFPSRPSSNVLGAPVWALFLVLSCSVQEPPQSPSEREFDWSSLLGQRLRSVKLFSGGLGPQGPVLEKQVLTLFSNGELEWQVADTSQRGTYRIVGERIVGRFEADEYEGEIDQERRILTWAGIEFEIP